MTGRLVDYVGSGLASALPAAATVHAALTTGAAGFFYASDTQVLYCLDRTGTPSWDLAVAGSGTRLIERYVGDATVGTKTFSSLGSYKNLKIVVNGTSTAVSTEELVYLRMNADTGANYDYQLEQIRNATLEASAASGSTFIQIGGMGGTTAGAGVAGATTTQIFDYSNTTNHKMALSTSFCKQGSATSAFRLRHTGGAWKNTAAVTSLTVYLTGGNFATGTIVELWGEY